MIEILYSLPQPIVAILFGSVGLIAGGVAVAALLIGYARTGSEQ